jgi:hypothetical protein
MAGFASNIRAWFRLIFTKRISRQFRDWAILNGDEVAVNLDSDVLLAKSGTNKWIPSVSTGVGNKISIIMTVSLGKE